MRDKKPVQYKSSTTELSGKIVWTQTTLTPILGENEEIVKLVGIDTDITELRDAQQKALEHAHKAGMADLAIDTVHNVGNILNSVNVGLEMLRGSAEKSVVKKIENANRLLRENLPHIDVFFSSDPKGKKLIEYYFELERNAALESDKTIEKINRLVERVSAISHVIEAQRKYADQPVAQSESVNIQELIHDALAIQAEALRHAGVTVKTRFSENPQVAVQRLKIVQILVELIHNGIDALHTAPEQHRVIEMALATTSSTAQLRIYDSGPGVEEEMLATIFSHGFTTKPERNGFGLHECANRMVEMGGKIWAERAGDPVQTFFILDIPLG